VCNTKMLFFALVIVAISVCVPAMATSITDDGNFTEPGRAAAMISARQDRTVPPIRCVAAGNRARAEACCSYRDDHDTLSAVQHTVSGCRSVGQLC
jgi:hypothetical protein